MAVSTVQNGQSGVYAGIAGSHRALMLRRHGREGLPPMSSIIPGQDAHARQEPGSELDFVHFPRTEKPCAIST